MDVVPRTVSVSSLIPSMSSPHRSLTHGDGLNKEWKASHLSKTKRMKLIHCSNKLNISGYGFHENKEKQVQLFQSTVHRFLAVRVVSSKSRRVLANWLRRVVFELFCIGGYLLWLEHSIPWRLCGLSFNNYCNRQSINIEKFSRSRSICRVLK